MRHQPGDKKQNKTKTKDARVKFQRPGEAATAYMRYLTTSILILLLSLSRGDYAVRKGARSSGSTQKAQTCKPPKNA